LYRYTTVGALEAVVKMLRSRNVETARYAAKAASELSLHEENGRKMVLGAGAGRLRRAGTYPKLHAPMLAKVPKNAVKVPKIACSDAGESTQKCRKSTQNCMLRCW
jgi:hypothetical protein